VRARARHNRFLWNESACLLQGMLGGGLRCSARRAVRFAPEATSPHLWLASTPRCLSGVGCRPVPGPRSARHADENAAQNDPKLIHRDQLDRGVTLKPRSIQRQTDLRAGIDGQNRVEARAPDRASKIRRRPGIGEENRAEGLGGGRLRWNRPWRTGLGVRGTTPVRFVDGS